MWVWEGEGGSEEGRGCGEGGGGMEMGEQVCTWVAVCVHEIASARVSELTDECARKRACVW